MAQYMTEDMFNKFRDIESGGVGHWTIARAINTGKSSVKHWGSYYLFMLNNY